MLPLRYKYVQILARILAWTIVIVFQFTALFPLVKAGSSSLNTTQARQRCSSEIVSQVLTNLTSPYRGYNRRIRPNYDGKALVVKVWYAVLGFRDIQEVDMTYVTDMYFRQQWVDDRLKHSLNCTLSFITGSMLPADFIWVADATFENSVTSHMHNVVTNNHRVDIAPDGTVLWGARVTAKAFCPMDLQTYPFDSQLCPLTIVSYNYPVTHLRYTWKTNPGVFVIDKELSQFIVSDVKTDEQDMEYAIGTYSRLTASFKLKRRLGYFIIQVYTPCMFLVVLAGFSFWVDSRATPARVALSLTTLLTTATIWSGINSSMPKVSYVKAIDIFFLTSFGFVFSTLLQYILLLSVKAKIYLRRSKKVEDGNIHSIKALPRYINNFIGFSKTIRRNEGVPTVPPSAEPMQGYSSFDSNNNKSSQGETSNTNAEEAKSGAKQAMTVDPEEMYYTSHKNELKCVLWFDKYSRVIYFLSYFIFNMIYWHKYHQS